LQHIASPKSYQKIARGPKDKEALIKLWDQE
jgi:hypothetical protein